MFSSRKSKISVFDTLAFFLPILFNKLKVIVKGYGGGQELRDGPCEDHKPFERFFEPRSLIRLHFFNQMKGH